MSYDCNLEFKPDGTPFFRGVDFSGGLSLHYRDKNHIVLKSRGGKYWAGIGMQSYAPASFYVYRIIDKISDTELKVERLVDFPVRAGASERWV